jgi:hypothetical protein
MDTPGVLYLFSLAGKISPNPEELSLFTNLMEHFTLHVYNIYPASGYFHEQKFGDHYQSVI